MATRWGCIGLGLIASDFFTAMKAHLPAEDHELVGVASRDVSRAVAFAERFGFKTAHASYEELAENPDIEVVYIATLHSDHAKHCCMMLNAGKHVLCEIPLALNSREEKKIVKLAREKKLFLMEGYWSRCFPVYRQLRKDLDDELFGKVWQVDASVCYNIDMSRNVVQREFGGGIFACVGLYNVQLACFVFPEMPVEIHAVGILNKDGIDEGGSFILKYKNGATCSFSFHGKTVFGPNRATIIGDKGLAKIDGSFHCPTGAMTPSGRIDFPLKSGEYNYPGSAGLSYEAAEVRRCLQEGESESPLCSLCHSELIITIGDEIRRQLGVIYPDDID